jgi:uncharacterized OB-fold protein
MSEMLNPLRPVPEPDPDSAPFWEGVNQGRLLVQLCRSCGRHRFPPGEICPECLSRETAWVEVSGRGRVYSWIVVRHPIPRDIFADEVPYCVALVELEEGVRIASNLIGLDPDAVRDGMEVEVVFRRSGNDRQLHAFRPAGAGGGDGR